MNYWNDNESLVKSLSRCKNHKQPQQGNPLAGNLSQQRILTSENNSQPSVLLIITNSYSQLRNIHDRYRVAPNSSDKTARVTTT